MIVKVNFKLRVLCGSKLLYKLNYCSADPGKTKVTLWQIIMKRKKGGNMHEL